MSLRLSTELNNMNSPSSTPGKLRAMASRMHRDASVQGVNVRQLLETAAKEIDRLEKRVAELESVTNVDLTVAAAKMHLRITDDDMNYRGEGAVRVALEELLKP